MVTEENTFEEIQAEFAKDAYASQAGCKVVEAKAGYSVCEMPITPSHLNANGGVMGGAMFTLCDFAMAVAANLDGKPTVAIECNIQFYRGVKGKTLIATCTADKAGRSVGFYTVALSDELGTNVGKFTCTAHRS